MNISSRRGRDLARIRAESYGLKGESWPRFMVTTSAAISSGVLSATLVPFQAGDVVTNIHVMSNVQSVSATLVKFGLYLPSTSELLAETASNHATFDASTGEKSTALVDPYTVPEDMGLYIAFLGVAGTNPGLAKFNGVVHPTATNPPVVTQSSQSDLPDPATFTAASAPIWFGWS